RSPGRRQSWATPERASAFGPRRPMLRHGVVTCPPDAAARVALDKRGAGRLHSRAAPMTRAAHQLTTQDGKPTPDHPWTFRTYAGHTSVRASNALYRGNLSRGQTGLSIAFDLPTQCGYSSDHPLAQPEIGKVGVPINTLDDFEVLFDAIPIEQINTSMTINATAI